MEQIKKGHQAPKGHRNNRSFVCAELEGNFSHSKTGNFVFTEEEQSRLLYNAQPCFYTDARYNEIAPGVFHNKIDFIWLKKGPISRSRKRNENRDIKKYINKGRRKGMKWYRLRSCRSTKACIRILNRVKGIPVGNVIRLSPWYHYKGKKIDPAFIYKIRKDRSYLPEFNISLPEYSAPVSWFGNLLRDNGFIVKQDDEYSTSYTAYGYNKIVGFTEDKDALFDCYYDARTNILFDFFQSFDKWSRSEQISKSLPIEEIMRILRMEESEYEKFRDTQ